MGMGGSGKETVTITYYTYRIRTAYAISFGPIDEFVRLDYNADFKTYFATRSGDSYPLAPSEQILYGAIYWGNSSQSASGNLSYMHEAMNYNNICYADFWLDLGEQPAMPAVAFFVTRYYAPELPDPYYWSYTTGPASGLNPAILLYDLLTNSVYGYGLSVDDIDVDSFVGAHIQLYGEELSCSTVIETAEVYAIVRSVLDWIDGEIIYRESDGKIGLRLRRKDYTLDELIQVHATDIRAQTFELQRPSWYATKNVIYVNFNDIMRECDQNLVYAEDMANFNLTGNQRVQEFSFNIFSNTTVAQKVAIRQLHRHSYPWAKVSFECFSTKGDALQIFEPFWLQHDYYNVAAVYRVTEKRRQSPNIWKIECVEECFPANAAFSVYSGDEPYPDPPYVVPQTIDWNHRIWDSYYRGYLILGYSDDQTTDVILDQFVISTELASTVCGYACIGRLTVPVNAGHDASLYVQKDKHFQDNFSTVHYLLIDDEIMKVSSVSETTDEVFYFVSLSNRALEETVQADHSDGTRVFAVECKAFYATNLIAGTTYSMMITPHYMHPILFYDSNDSDTSTITWEPLIDMPKTPSDLTPSSEDYLDDITFTWTQSSRVPPIPSPCAGMSPYPQIGGVDQILGWGYKISSGLTTTTITQGLTTLLVPNYVSSHSDRLAAGISTSFTFEVYAIGSKNGTNSVSATWEILE